MVNSVQQITISSVARLRSPSGGGDKVLILQSVAGHGRDDAERVRLITRTVYWTECYESWGAAVQLEVREAFLPPSDAVSMT